ncbi:sigma-70 family RNA polymerase sigma factor [Micromonospora sp. KC213]|nr:TetR family transcriptional regulator [Micromonospora sp. KC213]TDC43501.1 sigma-70 family RNA polymerase sigma factor [Micromonospora sp. KC213]
MGGRGNTKTFTVAQIAAALGVTHGTIYSHLDRAAA